MVPNGSPSSNRKRRRGRRPKVVRYHKPKRQHCVTRRLDDRVKYFYGDTESEVLEEYNRGLAELQNPTRARSDDEAESELLSAGLRAAKHRQRRPKYVPRKQNRDIPFVHWHSYETTKIRAYIDRRDDADDVGRQITDCCVDLLPITRNQLESGLSSRYARPDGSRHSRLSALEGGC